MTVRVLALCGFTQNATIYFKQVSCATFATSELTPSWELSEKHVKMSNLVCPQQSPSGSTTVPAQQLILVFLEPPIIVEKVDMPWNSNMDDFDSSATTEAETQTPETTPRAWWLSSADRQTYRREL